MVFLSCPLGQKVFKHRNTSNKMKKIKFYDVKAKKDFNSNKYVFKAKRNPKTKRMTYFVVANAPSGIKSWRIVSKDFYLGNK